jgi:hypothetical protein
MIFKLAGGGGRGGLTFLLEEVVELPVDESSLSLSFSGGGLGFRQLEAADILVATVDTLRILLLLKRVKVVPDIELAELDDRQLLELGPRPL